MSGKALTVFCRKNTCILIFHRTSKHEPLDPGTFISYSATAIIVISGPLSFIFNFFFYIKEHHSRIFRGSPAVCFISVWNDCAFSFIPFIIHVKLYKILTFFRACVSFLNLIFSPFWATRTSRYKGGRFYGAIVCVAGPPFPGVIFHSSDCSVILSLSLFLRLWFQRFLLTYEGGLFYVFTNYTTFKLQRVGRLKFNRFLTV